MFEDMEYRSSISAQVKREATATMNATTETQIKRPKKLKAKTETDADGEPNENVKNLSDKQRATLVKYHEKLIAKKGQTHSKIIIIGKTCTPKEHRTTFSMYFEIINVC